MDIYVVQQGDTIDSIAEKYGVTVEKIVIDNGIEHPDHLAIGQTIVIVYPKQTHVVQQDDTLQSIADTYNVSVIQLLRNNPFQSDRESIY
ncbi:MAG: Peptidoglycan-binding lysin domain protein [Herbinix sp.]|jgi:spore germination protein|nr:Peptidoglycan-binding lysin domain protein [Herbinix sp.]